MPDSLSNNRKNRNADSVKSFVERDLVLDLFEEHVQALQTLANIYVERKITLTEPIQKI